MELKKFSSLILIDKKFFFFKISLIFIDSKIMNFNILFFLCLIYYSYVNSEKNFTVIGDKLIYQIGEDFDRQFDDSIIITDFLIPFDGFLTKYTYMMTRFQGSFCLVVWRKSRVSVDKTYFIKLQHDCRKSAGGDGNKTVEIEQPIFVKKNDVIGIDLEEHKDNPIATTEEKSNDWPSFNVNYSKIVNLFKINFFI